MKYRRDRRTVEQFAKDIKATSDIENRLMALFIAHLNKTTKSVWTHQSIGVDSTGTLIKDDKKVSADPDFEIYKNQTLFGKFDVKFSRKKVDCLHLKENQIKKYIKQGAGVILFMDIESPKFVMLTAIDLETICKDNKRVMFWDKWCRKIETKDYQWTNL